MYGLKMQHKKTRVGIEPSGAEAAIPGMREEGFDREQSQYQWWGEETTEHVESASHRPNAEDDVPTTLEHFEEEMNRDLHKELDTLTLLPEVYDTKKKPWKMGLRGVGGMEEEIERSTTGASDVSSEAADRAYRMTVMHRMRENVQGIYQGTRSASPSPCPAPFVVYPQPDVTKTPEPSTSRPEQKRSPTSQRSIIATAKLYLAFKRADEVGNDWPSTEDIRQSLLKDSIVQEIFDLRKCQVPVCRADAAYKRCSLDRDAVERNLCLTSSAAPGTSTPSSAQHSNRRVFGQQGDVFSSDVDGGFFNFSKLRNRFSDALSALWGDAPPKGDMSSSFLLSRCAPGNFCTLKQGASTFQPQSSPESSLQQCCRKGSNWFKYITRNVLAMDNSHWDWTLEAKEKLAVMLGRLHNLETEAAVCVSKRQKNCVVVGFPKYAEIFAPFLKRKYWAAGGQETPESKERQPLQAQHRLLGPALGERLVRDGYLGTNLSQFDVGLPGRIGHPRTVRMEGPSCALAPKNRGALPRRQTLPSKPQRISDGEAAAIGDATLREMQDREMRTDTLLRDTLICFRRYNEEVRALRGKIARAKNHEFLVKSPAKPPPTTAKESFQIFPEKFQNDMAPVPPYTEQGDEEDLLLTGFSKVPLKDINGSFNSYKPTYYEASMSPFAPSALPSSASSTSWHVDPRFNWNPTPVSMPHPPAPRSPVGYQQFFSEENSLPSHHDGAGLFAQNNPKSNVFDTAVQQTGLTASNYDTHFRQQAAGSRRWDSYF